MGTTTSRDPLIFVVFGPGGVGKGTLVDRLLQLRAGLWLSRSWTTRPRRPGEALDAYVFVDREEFLERVRAGGFVEWTEFSANGHLYGTPAIEPPPGQDVVLEIEVDGARQVKAAYPGAVLVMVVAPSRQAQAERLEARGDAPAQVRRRLDVGEQEQREGRQIAAHVVVNDEVERASTELAGIVDHYRAVRGSQGAGGHRGGAVTPARGPASTHARGPAGPDQAPAAR